MRSAVERKTRPARRDRNYPTGRSDAEVTALFSRK